MKKYACVILAILFFVGMGTASTVTAALVYDGLSIDVDFWTSASDRLGPGDQGGTFNLGVGEEIKIDFYLTTALNISFLSFDLQFDPSQVQVTGQLPASSPSPLAIWFSPSLDITIPGSAKFATGPFSIDPTKTGPTTVTGSNIFFATLVLQCMDIGTADLILANYLGFDVNLPVTGNISIAPPGDIGTLNQAVPIPGAVWLLGTGLVGLVGLRRKFRK